MFYKGELDGVLAEFIDDLPLMLAVDIGLGIGGVCRYFAAYSTYFSQFTWRHLPG
jgi:hypothetical protein